MDSPLHGTLSRAISIPRGIAYAIALVSTTAATLVRLALDPIWGFKVPYILFYPTILVSGWFGGVGPGVVATILSATAAAYFWLEPPHSWAIANPSDIIGLAAFIAVGVAISAISEAWRRQTNRVASLLRSERDAHAQVAAAAKQMQIAIESGQMGTWEYDIRTGAVRWSAALEAIHGYAPGEFPGTFTAFRDEILDEDRERVVSAVTASMQGSGEHHIEYRIVRRDGSVRWVEGRGQLFRDGDGKPQRMVGVCVDVTERKHADERFRMAVEAAPTAIFMVNQTGTIVMMNALAEQLLGYQRGDLIGSPIDQLVPERVRESHRRYRESFTREASPRPMGAGRELFAMRKDGTEVPVEIGLSPMRTTEGVFTLAAIADITERNHVADLQREAMRRTEELNQLKDQFLATLSHELRTPINSILGYAQLLSLATLPPDRVRQAIEAIERNANSQARLIESLLDLSRLQSGKFGLRLEQLDLGTVVSRAADVVRPAADAKGISLRLALPAWPLQVSGDADRLQQVVWNILANAVKFTPSGGEVVLQLERVDEEARIEVKDTGTGMSADFLPHAFERFRQADVSGTTPTSGLGIGLALVKELVEAHGGSVTAKSPGAGKGSTFAVALPLRGESDRAAGIPSLPDPADHTELTGGAHPRSP
jgi:PAS domain S-box-containing protein